MTYIQFSSSANEHCVHIENNVFDAPTAVGSLLPYQHNGIQGFVYESYAQTDSALDFQDMVNQLLENATNLDMARNIVANAVSEYYAV